MYINGDFVYYIYIYICIYGMFSLVTFPIGSCPAVAGPGPNGAPMGRAIEGPLGPLAFVGQALVGPLGPLWAMGGR